MLFLLSIFILQPFRLQSSFFSNHHLYQFDFDGAVNIVQGDTIPKYSHLAYRLTYLVTKTALVITMSSDISKEYLPTFNRRIIQDIGCAITHKRIILKLYKNGYQTPDIARMTNHTEEACDRYIKAYKKVEKLSKTMNIGEIAQVLEMSRSLVEEYINILNEEEDK